MEKTIVMQGSTTNAILALATSGKAFNAQLETLADTMAAEVSGIEGITTAQKIALLNEVYSAPLAQVKSQKDVMAKLNGLILARVAGSAVQVEIAPPSKDGKSSAVFASADKLTATQAKKYASEIRAAVAEAEESSEARAARLKKEELAKMAKQVVANKIAAEEANQRRETAFAFVLSEPCRQELTERLEAQGWKLVKIKTAPAK